MRTDASRLLAAMLRSLRVSEPRKERNWRRVEPLDPAAARLRVARMDSGENRKFRPLAAALSSPMQSANCMHESGMNESSLPLCSGGGIIVDGDFVFVLLLFDVFFWAPFWLLILEVRGNRRGGG